MLEARGRRGGRSTALRCLLAVLLAVTTGACSAWALSSGSAVQRAGEQTYSQVQVMSLVSDVAQRAHPPTATLEVILEDARAVLERQEDELAALPGSGPHRDEVLDLTRQALEVLEPLRIAADRHDEHDLQRVGRDLARIAGRFVALGMT